MALDSAPRGIPLSQLALIARSDPGLETADLEVTRASRGDLQQAAYDLPSEADAVQKPSIAPPEDPQLNRNPGRLFAPKKHPMEVGPDSDPKPVDQPKPTDPVKPDTDLSRNPGRLFGK
jgi:hypothetical protein